MRQGETLFPGEEVRSNVLKAIGSVATKGSTPDPEFAAMWAVANQPGSRLRWLEKEHLKRMIAIQIELITNQTDDTVYSPEDWSAIQGLLAANLKAFREQNPHSLPEIWLSALQDVLKLQSKTRAYSKKRLEYSNHG